MHEWQPWPKPSPEALQRAVDAFLASGKVGPAPDDFRPIAPILGLLRAFVAEKGIAEAAGHISQEAFARALGEALVDKRKVPYWVGVQILP